MAALGPTTHKFELKNIYINKSSYTYCPKRDAARKCRALASVTWGNLLVHGLLAFVEDFHSKGMVPDPPHTYKSALTK